MALPDWTVSTTYGAGDYVEYNDVLWMATKSTAGEIPGTGTAWNRITGGREVISLLDMIPGSTYFSPDVQGTGLDGLDGGKYFIFKNGVAADEAILRVQKSDNYTGGTPGQTKKAIWAYHGVGANVTDFQWTILAELNNSATAGENVAITGYARKQSTGPTWGGVMTAKDTTNTANPASGMVGLEVDIFANGTDSSNRRIGIDVVAGTSDAGVTLPTVGVGIQIGPQNGNAANGKYTRALKIYGDVVIGIDMSLMTNSTNAIRLAREGSIAWEATSTYTMALGSGGSSVVSLITSGTSRIGFDIGGTRRILIDSVQVVGARDTGWTAMTGSSNENTAYDTSTVTLAQLAGRVMAIQAALTTHGLIGA